MTAPTHATFAVLIASFFGAPAGSIAACALGGLAPDIDHPQSSIGRVLFFLSIPINMRYGHRGLIHAFVVWIPFIIIGIFFKPLLWFGIGAFSHILIDCWNISGVRALVPMSNKTLVLFQRDDWRIRTGSVPEIFVFLILAGLVSLSGYSIQIGGARKLINYLMQSPRIAAEEFQRAELRQCYIQGKFRWNNGFTEDVKWLVIGTENGGSSLAFWNEKEKRIIRNDKGEFMRARLIETQNQWWIVTVKGIVTVLTPSFWMAEKENKWHFSDMGQSASGTVKALDCKYPKMETMNDGNGQGFYPSGS